MVGRKFVVLKNFMKPINGLHGRLVDFGDEQT